VLDPRTLMVLFKLCNNDRLSKVEGCISTGKEANVYYATGKCDLLSASFQQDEAGSDIR